MYSEKLNNVSFNLNQSLKIAIDGPAGAGKSSVARELARRLQLKYLDTGAMYRAITLKLIRENTPLDDFAQVAAVLERTSLDLREDRRVYLDGADVTAEIRSPLVNQLVSPVSSIPLVRRRLVAMQQEIAASSRRIVMEGRDITSKVMPEADYKFYLDATVAERARRRRQEHLDQGLDLPLGEVTAGIRERDRIDSGRADSPLVITPDSTVIDTSGLSFEQVVSTLIAAVTGATN